MIRSGLRVILALFYLVAGIFHLAAPEPFLSIMPSFIPAPEAVVALTGVAELAGSIALIQPWSDTLCRWAGIGLALYALCVWPANMNHFALDMAKPDGGLGLGYHIPRMIAQPILIWLALWTGRAMDWPFAPARKRDQI
ncbi:DoxX family protein [Altericroceibacterium endophyticum]|uniref:DoxX family membrane protein n=1 Tax=Altericroceibacterium endophyticum TaxID=1808508 RepID=A0A6I4T860_9SPHN|nr:DoxX family protein [Altericroceibacterium endophyticum]MXO66967.1 DoxX family membrane protein [Altericroceibacterium endophyticum]